jgi:hypothetical protein
VNQRCYRWALQKYAFAYLSITDFIENLLDFCMEILYVNFGNEGKNTPHYPKHLLAFSIKNYEYEFYGKRSNGFDVINS